MRPSVGMDQMGHHQIGQSARPVLGHPLIAIPRAQRINTLSSTSTSIRTNTSMSTNTNELSIHQNATACMHAIM